MMSTSDSVDYIYIYDDDNDQLTIIINSSLYNNDSMMMISLPEISATPLRSSPGRSLVDLDLEVSDDSDLCSTAQGVAVAGGDWEVTYVSPGSSMIDW